MATSPSLPTVVLVLFLAVLNRSVSSSSSPSLSALVEATALVLPPPHGGAGNRHAMFLPLFLSPLNSSSVVVSKSRRQLQGSTRSTAHMRLYDDLLLNGYYTTRLWIGTPRQKFALIVDTGSTVTYVPCSTC